MQELKAPEPTDPRYLRLIFALLDRNVNGSYELVCTGENSVPADLGEYGRYLVIPAGMLPESMNWNDEKYRGDLETYIKTKLLEANKR